MTLIKLLLILALGAGAYEYVVQPSVSPTADVPEAVVDYEGPQIMGFQEIGGQVQAGNEVMIFAPKNCSGAVAQRALRIAESLKSQGIPVKATNHISLAFSGKSQQAFKATAERSQRNMERLMGGEGPFVFINNHGRANPSVEQITAAYSAMKSG